MIFMPGAPGQMKSLPYTVGILLIQAVGLTQIFNFDHSIHVCLSAGSDLAPCLQFKIRFYTVNAINYCAYYKTSAKCGFRFLYTLRPIKNITAVNAQKYRFIQPSCQNHLPSNNALLYPFTM